MQTLKKDSQPNFKYIFVFMLVFAFTFNLKAQDVPLEVPQQEQGETNFDDQELQQFASAAEKVMMLQQATEQRMVRVIEEENLELDKFNEILRSQQTQEAEAVQASEEEMASFNNAAEKIIQIQTEVQSEMMRTIQEEGLEPQKYEQIMLAYQSDPEVKARIDALLHASDDATE